MSKKQKESIKKGKENKFDSAQNDEYNDDVQIEEEGMTETDAVKKLKKKLSDCQGEKREYLDGWQRSKADFANAKKDFEDQKKEYVEYARGGLFEELLPVVDSFDMAFANKEAWEKVDENWRVGVEYIHSQLLKVLTDNGLNLLDPIGEKFDPRCHISVEVVETNDKKQDDHIVEVRQKGYALHDKVVRVPKVTVFSYRKK